MEDGRAFGKLLGDAVTKSNELLLGLAGFMILFSVLSRLSVVLLPASLTELFSVLLPGLMEPHLGSQAAARLLPDSTSVSALAWIGAALAWSGLSLHAQVKGLMHRTSLRYSVFLVGRLFHTAAAFILTWLLASPLSRWLEPVQASFIRLPGPTDAGPWHLPAMWSSLPWNLGLLLAGLAAILVLSAFAYGLLPLIKRIFKQRT